MEHVKRIGLAVALLGTGACVAPDGAEDLSSTQQSSRSCPDGFCGLNSPRIEYQGFHELEKHGLVNAEGFAITQFEKNGVPYTLEVKDNRLIGIGVPFPIEHGELVGARIHVSQNGRPDWVITVKSVGRLDYFVGAPGSVETYVLVYSRASGGPEYNVCGGIEIPEDDRSVDGIPTESFGQQVADSILFDLDRVDPRTMTLNDVPNTNWFNIGCAGHTLSKLFLTRNMMASQGGAPGLHDARQATLKMLVADYFGDGTTFTVAGQRLDWQGAGIGGIGYFSAPKALEARWGASGAICLNTPRMTQPTTAEGSSEFPDIERALREHAAATGQARPRPCRSSSTAPVLGELRTSALR